MTPRNPYPTVDIVIETGGGIVLVHRAHEPRGWALPGGFVDYGERYEDAARREAMEETGLDVELTDLLGVYSDPTRDPRHHTASVVFVGRATGEPRAGDDADRAEVFALDHLPSPLVFDHADIVRDYAAWRASGVRPPLAGPRLGRADRAHIALTAKDELDALLSGRARHQAPWESRGVLAEPGACFVTLRRRNGELRGCIGTTEARAPLGATIREMARAAAQRDPRFPPVEPAERDDLTLEVSVLSAPRRISDVSEIEVGRHGLVVTHGARRGLLLPQVATEQRWDRTTFLAHTCVKAGLPPDAWRDPATEIEVFSADVIEESEAQLAG